MTSISRLFVPILALTLLVGCGDGQTEAPLPPPEDIAFELIGYGRDSRLHDSIEIRISDAETWRTYADSLSPVGTLEDVDFGEQDILLVALPVTSGGYDLTFTQIQERGGELRIGYRIESPGEDCLVAQVMLTPFAAIAIQKTDAEPVFFSRIMDYRCSLR